MRDPTQRAHERGSLIKRQERVMRSKKKEKEKKKKK